MENKAKIISSLILGTCLLSLVSCGSDSSNGSGADTTQQEQQQQDDQGIYRAVLRPLNSSVAGTTSGTVEITIEGDEIVAESNVTGAPSGVKHLQNITVASACPTSSSDVNGDSFVDMVETLPSTGPILIPLDSDISEQLNGMAYGPIANGSGSYIYRRSTTVSEILSDLHALDPDVADPIAKLVDGQNLNLAGRVILIHGVSSSSNLPSTVATVGDLSAAQSLPIACGELVRVSSEDTSVSEPTTVVE
jgi:hypothetical protein